MIHVIATIDLNPGQRPPFIAEFQKVAPQVRAEAGCLEYGLAVDVSVGLEGQPPLREDSATVIEKWTDGAALKAHLATPHMKEFFQRTSTLVRDLKIQVLQPV